MCSRIYFDRDPHLKDTETRPLEETRNDENSTSELGLDFIASGGTVQGYQ
ncbi:hypothetical protein ACYULU_09545 [Breznakiellaceae bacterium SP9]